MSNQTLNAKNGLSVGGINGSTPLTVIDNFGNITAVNFNAVNIAYSGLLTLANVTTGGDILTNSTTPSTTTTTGALVVHGGAGIVGSLNVGNSVNAASGAFTSSLTVGGYSVLTSFSGGLGYGQTWQNVIGSRVYNTSYTNLTGKPIMISVASTYNGSGSYMTLIIDGVTIGISGTNNPTIDRNTISAIIPAGSSYQINSAAGMSLFCWAELR